KGVLQKLFTQQTRFKDGSGNSYPAWEEKRLGDLGSFKTSSVDKISRENQVEVRLINYMDVYRHVNITPESLAEFSTTTVNKKQLDDSCLKKGDILFTPS